MPCVYRLLDGNLLLLAVLDVYAEEAKSDNDPQRGNNAQGRVYGDVHAIRLDSNNGSIFGWTVPHPVHLTTALQIQGSRHPTVFAYALFMD